LLASLLKAGGGSERLRKRLPVPLLVVSHEQRQRRWLPETEKREDLHLQVRALLLKEARALPTTTDSRLCPRKLCGDRVVAVVSEEDGF
jgi:hypothetical protein